MKEDGSSYNQEAFSHHLHRFEVTMPVNMERDPRTGLSILVVGGGIAGLCFAIEAYRKGHNVRVVERRAGLDPYGV